MSTIQLTPEEQKEYDWLGLGNINDLNLPDPLSFDPSCDRRFEFFKLLATPEHFYITCKYIFNIELLPTQQVILYQMWHHKFPILIGSRGFGKSFILGLYVLLRMLFMPGRKIVICGAGFRQAKFVFNYIERIYNNAPMLRNIAGQRDGSFKDADCWTFKLHGSEAYAIPIGDGTKIRGLRANDIISDEFATMNLEIFQTVIQGFGAVSADPVANVKRIAELKLLKERGELPEDYEPERDEASNQIILSGTTSYYFNHFAKYWEEYKAFIKSGGDKDKIRHIFADGEVPKHFNWKNYVIIRIPYELIPEGMMDDETIARAKATTGSVIYSMEYGAVFPKDSEGFFKRSLIESCVAGGYGRDGIELPSGLITFGPKLRGNPNGKYVIGIDPASESDNFSICVLELYPDHRRVVYCWTSTRQRHRALLKKDNKLDDDFFAFCARKIRNLMKLFPCENIAMDTQGGGIPIQEALHATKNLRDGETKIWPVILEDKEQPTDAEVGLHILHNINFSEAKWVEEANQGLKADMESKRLLFPKFDTIEVGLSVIDDNRHNREYDTLEDCLYEIEEMKVELSTIVHTQTPTGRDKWDTPEIKTGGQKKGRLKKDRYSALLMANMVARKLFFKEESFVYEAHGGMINQLDIRNLTGPFAAGPAWYQEALKDGAVWYGYGISSTNRNGV